MHEAKENGDVTRLEEISRIAAGEQTWIDANATGYKHSRQSCALCHTVSVFTLLERRARLNARIIELAAVLK